MQKIYSVCINISSKDVCISFLCPLETPHKKNSKIEKVCVDFVTGLLVDKRERLLVCNCGQVTEYSICKYIHLNKSATDDLIKSRYNSKSKQYVLNI